MRKIILCFFKLDPIKIETLAEYFASKGLPAPNKLPTRVEAPTLSAIGNENKSELIVAKAECEANGISPTFPAKKAVPAKHKTSNNTINPPKIPNFIKVYNLLGSIASLDHPNQVVL